MRLLFFLTRLTGFYSKVSIEATYCHLLPSPAPSRTGIRKARVKSFTKTPGQPGHSTNSVQTQHIL